MMPFVGVVLGLVIGYVIGVWATNRGYGLLLRAVDKKLTAIGCPPNLLPAAINSVRRETEAKLERVKKIWRR